MDRYDFNIKVEQLQRLLVEGDDHNALRITDSIEWRRVHNAELLVKVSELYERAGRFAEAKEILLQAYDRAPVGRRLLFKLVGLALELGEVKEAEAYRSEYEELWPKDNGRHLLRYMLLKAKKAPPDRRIDVLEKYNEKEIDERWRYELALNYHQAGRREDCVRLCDNIMLLFGVGEFVEKAAMLKTVEGVPLTEYQQNLLRNKRKLQERLKRVAAIYASGNVPRELKAMELKPEDLYSTRFKKEEPEEKKKQPPEAKKSSLEENSENIEISPQVLLQMMMAGASYVPKEGGLRIPTPEDVASGRVTIPTQEELLQLQEKSAGSSPGGVQGEGGHPKNWPLEDAPGGSGGQGDCGGYVQYPEEQEILGAHPRYPGSYVLLGGDGGFPRDGEMLRREPGFPGENRRSQGCREPSEEGEVPPGAIGASEESGGLEASAEAALPDAAPEDDRGERVAAGDFYREREASPGGEAPEDPVVPESQEPGEWKVEPLPDISQMEAINREVEQHMERIQREKSERGRLARLYEHMPQGDPREEGAPLPYTQEKSFSRGISWEPVDTGVWAIQLDPMQANYVAGLSQEEGEIVPGPVFEPARQELPDQEEEILEDTRPEAVETFPEEPQPERAKEVPEEIQLETEAEALEVPLQRGERGRPKGSRLRRNSQGFRTLVWTPEETGKEKSMLQEDRETEVFAEEWPRSGKTLEIRESTQGNDFLMGKYAQADTQEEEEMGVPTVSNVIAKKGEQSMPGGNPLWAVPWKQENPVEPEQEKEYDKETVIIEEEIEREVVIPVRKELLHAPSSIVVEGKTPQEAMEAAVSAIRKVNELTGKKRPVVKIKARKLNIRGVMASADKIAGKDLLIEEAGDLNKKIVEELVTLIQRKEQTIVFSDTPMRVSRFLKDNPALYSLSMVQRETVETVSRGKNPPLEKNHVIGGGAVREKKVLPIRKELTEEDSQETSTEAFQAASRESLEETAKEASRSPLAEEEKRENLSQENRPKRSAASASDGEKTWEEEPEALEEGKKPQFSREIEEGKELSVDEFAQAAVAFAEEIDCVISRKSMLAMYERIDIMKEEGFPLTRKNAEILIDGAADLADKPSVLKKIFGVFAPKYDKEGKLILREEHFQY